MRTKLSFIIGILLCLLSVESWAQRASFNINGKAVTADQTVDICIGAVLNFTNNVNSGITGVSWRFENGSPSSSTSFFNESVSYNTVGSGKAVQTISLFNGTKDSLSVIIRVNNTFPTAGFSFSPTTLECGSSNFNFTSTSVSGPLTYNWSFDDGGTSNSQNPVYQFTKAIGNAGSTAYDVRLIVTNTSGCADTANQTVTVKNIPDIRLGTPNPDVTVSQQTIKRCVNIPSYQFEFANQSTTTNVNYTINWGEGNADSIFSSWPGANTIKHTYTIGNHTLTVTATGPAPNSCVVKKEYIVFLGSNPKVGLDNPGNTDICSSDSLTFPLSSISLGNAKGTIYSFYVNDNTPALDFTTLPSTVTHVFPRGSCGIQSDVYSNSYEATIYAENPCGSSKGSIVPVYVSGKPEPKIGISPSNNVCVNNKVTISNTTYWGDVITLTGGTGSTCGLVAGKSVWAISPATGYTINSGTLGSVNGSPLNPGLWNPFASGSLDVTFTQAGTYKVKLYVSGSRCPDVDSVEQTICVRIPPTASFTLDKHSICAPDNVKATNTSPAGGCGGESYRWDVQFNDTENCGTGNGFSFATGSTATSANPEMSFAKPGRYIISLTVTANASGCTSAKISDTIFVKDKPKVTLPNIAGACAGNALTPTATVTNCYSSSALQYAWTFTGGTPATSNAEIPGAINYSGNGTFPIDVKVTNECGDATATKTVVIGPKPTANAGADAEACSGKPVSIGSAAVTGVSYTWTPATGLSSANIANPSVNIVYSGAAADTTYQFVVRAFTGADCFNTDTVLVKIKRGPTVSVSPLAASVCTGGATVLTASGADNYSWAPATGLTPSNQAVVNASPTVTTDYTVTGSLANGCSATAMVKVSVVPFTPANAGPDQEYCSGKSVAIGVIGTGMNYSWTPASGLSNANIANPSVNFTYNGPAEDTILLYTLTASAGANCSSTDAVSVKVKRSPLVDVNPVTTDICVGGSVTLTANGADTYAWLPLAGLNLSTGASVVASPASNTTYTVTGSLTNGCSAAATSTINVKAVPTVSAGNDTTACNNTAIVQLHGSPSSGVWSGNANVSNGGIFNPMAAGNGSYKLYYSLSANGCSGIDSMQVTVTNPPVANAGADTAFCAVSGTARLTGSPAGGTWGNNAVIQPNGTLDLTAAGTYQLVYSIGAGACIGTDTVSVTIGNSVANNTIAAPQGICFGAIPAPLIGAASTAGSYTVGYQWQSSLDSINWTNLPGEISKDLTLGSTTQTIFYRRIASTALCAAGAPSNVVKVFIHPNAKADFNPTITTDCAPFVLTPAIVNLTAYPDRNSSYQWFVNNVSIGIGETFPGYTINAAADTVMLKLVTLSQFGCVNDTTETQFITRPVATPAFSKDTAQGCGPLTVTFTNNTPDRDKYQYRWDFGNGQTSTDAQPAPVQFAINPNYGDTTYYIRFTTFNECKTITLVDSVLVRAQPKALFTPDIVEGCSPMKVTFTNTSRGSNATFVWDFGDGSAQVPATNPTIQHIFNTGVKDTFYVKLIGSNDCGKDTQQYAIVVNPNRIRLDFAVNGNQKNLCIPDTVLFVNNTTGANKFEWDFGDGSPKLTTTKGIDSVYHEYTQRGVYTVTLFGTNGCSDTTSTETITVENRPNVSFTATPSEVCLGGTIQMTNTSDTSLAWAWDFGDGSTSSQLNPAKTYANTGNYIITLTGTKVYPQGFGCPATATANVVVNGPAGELRYKAGFACLGDAIQLETISSNTSQYRYYLGNGDSIISTTPVVNYTYKLPGTYLPSVLLVAGNCSKLVKGIDSIKIDRIQAGFKFNPVYSCGATRINFTDTSDAYFGIVKREWNFGDGTTASSANPFKTYSSAGSYNVRLRITGASGCTAVFDTLVNVQVRDIPVAAISSDNFACTNNRILFIAATQSIDAIVGHNWSFGNNTNGTGDIAATNYNSAGSYTVTLTSRTSFGCADTVTKTITVRQSPTVTASANVRICLGQSTQLNVGGAANYQWSPAEGLSCTTCANPIASPTITTQYLATGTNAIGCPNTDSVTVEVVQPFTMTVTANDTLCIGQSSQLFASGANRYVWNPSVGLSASNIPNPIATPNSTTTYRVVGFDSYNCFTDTAYTVVAVGGYPTVELGRGDTVVAGTAITFKPILTNGPFKNFFWTPTTGLSPNNVENPVATINNAITYTLVAENIYGCTGTDTISYQVFCSKDDQVYIPNAFSPDGDGVNDVFMVYGKGIKVDYFRVYNRWGQVVFDGGSNYLPNLAQYGWNGRVGGKPATQDVYVYMVQLKCTAGGTFTYKGNVSLLLMR